jgi:hypothetical protein
MLKLYSGAIKPPAVIHTTFTSPFGGPSESDGPAAMTIQPNEVAITNTGTTNSPTASLNTTEQTTKSTAMDIDDNLNSPTKVTPNSSEAMHNTNTAIELRTTLDEINAATTNTADLTISPRQNNILNFNDFDNESTAAEVMQKTRCDIRLNIRPSGRFATSQDIFREVRAFIQELRNCDPTVMILPWYTNSSDTYLML